EAWLRAVAELQAAALAATSWAWSLPPAPPLSDPQAQHQQQQAELLSWLWRHGVPQLQQPPAFANADVTDDRPEQTDMPKPAADKDAPGAAKPGRDKSQKSGFACEICGKMFSAHYNLTRHMPVHTGPGRSSA
uniref:C2H2-type domain-containing protein n=1 Tax=Macrostomum lignano TaxID=282301 RepID=A0A1I8HWL0_9PLAT